MIGDSPLLHFYSILINYGMSNVKLPFTFFKEMDNLVLKVINYKEKYPQ